MLCFYVFFPFPFSFFFFFKQKTAYEMRISDWSSDVCSSDLPETYANIDAISRNLGFAPTTSIEAGIPRFVDWFKAYHQLEMALLFRPQQEGDVGRIIPAALTAGVKHAVKRRAQTELAGGQSGYHQKLAGVQLHAMPPAAVEQLGQNRVALTAQRAEIAAVIMRLADDAFPFGHRMLAIRLVEKAVQLHDGGPQPGR